MPVQRPPMRYHGGKWKMAAWIIAHFPRHRIYVEPFGGAGAVLLQKQRSHTEVYNDLWDDVVGVFRVLRDPEKAALLRQQCELTPFARTEMLLSDEPSGDEIEAARRIIFRSFSGFGSASANSLHKTGFRSNSKQSGSPPAIDWRNWPAHIDSFTERLRGVVIECRPALELIPQHDDAETLFYLDPPYVHNTRGMCRRNAAYRHEMTDDDHSDLASILHEINGMAILSGYRCDLYETLYGDWRRIDRRSYADGAAKRIESLWLNHAASKHGQQRFNM